MGLGMKMRCEIEIAVEVGMVWVEAEIEIEIGSAEWEVGLMHTYSTSTGACNLQLAICNLRFTIVPWAFAV